MTQHRTYISIEANETDLSQLLKTVAESHQSIRILSDGTPVAELSPLPPRRVLGGDPLLKATFLTDSEELMSEEDWPEHLRIDVEDLPGDRR
jgi:antitoxin (DNA-binding transcriptional repressor) of toxin-antitoxin stability system